MALHDAVLFIRQFAGLVEYLIGYFDFADIVEHAAYTDLLKLISRQTQRPSQGNRQNRDAQ